ncbi:hypothetical protein BHM03_00049714 [Ensete ventricosum]|nr:hypothetical protein BHM03_00049714 [Ensete ventricosum]
MKRHNPTLASTRVHVLDLCPRKAPCFRSMSPSSTLTPFMRLRYFTKFHPSTLPQHVRFVAHDSPSREPGPIPPEYLPVGATFLFAFLLLEVSETTIPFGLLHLAEQLVPCSALANALARSRLFANIVPTAPFKRSRPRPTWTSLHTRQGPGHADSSTTAPKSHNIFGTRRRANVARTPVKQPQLRAPRWSSPYTPTNFADRGTELAPPDEGNKRTEAYTEPLLEATQRPKILSPNSKPRATYCLRRGVSKSNPPGPYVGWVDANHSSQSPPIRREQPDNKDRAVPNRGRVEKSGRLGNETREPFLGHCACALRVGRHLLEFDRLNKGTTAPSQQKARRSPKGVRQVKGGSRREFQGQIPVYPRNIGQTSPGQFLTAMTGAIRWQLGSIRACCGLSTPNGPLRHLRLSDMPSLPNYSERSGPNVVQSTQAVIHFLCRLSRKGIQTQLPGELPSESNNHVASRPDAGK